MNKNRSNWMVGLYCSAMLAISVGSASPASADLLTNGSFETPVQSSGSFQLVSTGFSFTGWSVVGASGNVAVVNGAFTGNGFSFPAQEGSQWLDLTGNSNSATGVQQTVATTVGAGYDLSFWVGNTNDPGGAFGTSSAVQVFVGGASAGTFTNSGGAGTNTLTWQQFTLNFTASSTSTDIAFLNLDPPSDNNNGLDNVQLLVSTESPVPEPGALALLGASLLGVGARAVTARKRRRS